MTSSTRPFFKRVAELAPFASLIAALLTTISYLATQINHIIMLSAELGNILHQLNVALSQFYPILAIIALFVILTILLFYVTRQIRRKAVKVSEEHDRAARKEYDKAVLFFSVAVIREEAGDNAKEGYLRAIDELDKAISPTTTVMGFRLKLGLVISAYRLRLKGISYEALYELSRSKEEKAKYFNMAISCIEAAAAEYLRRDDIQGTAQCYRSLGQLYRKENQKEQAATKYREAEKLFLQAYMYSMAALCSKEQADLIGEKEPEKQIELLTAAARWFEADRFLWESAIMYRHIGYLNVEIGKKQDAAVNFEKAAERFEEDLYFWEAAETYKKAGAVFQAIGDMHRSRDCYNKALKKYQFAGYDYEEKQMQRLLRG